MTYPDPYSQDPYQQQPPYQPQPPHQPQQPYGQQPPYQAQQPGYPVSGAPQPYQQPGYPVSGVPQSYPPAPYAGYGVPAGAYQYDPATGLPLSDKSKLAAGLLQLIPGFCLALGGIGRIYMGHIGIGIAQLVLGVVSWIALVCLGFLILPIFLIIAPWLWSIVDGIVILAGQPVDQHGRPLRP